MIAGRDHRREPAPRLTRSAITRTVPFRHVETANMKRKGEIKKLARHSRESGNPDGLTKNAFLSCWIPAFAGMTARVS
jgi:hypothetical protein